MLTNKAVLPNRCTDACCQGNSTGTTTCTLDGQCGGGNHCTGSTCYANEQGSPCSLDSQCGASRNCTNGECQ